MTDIVSKAKRSEMMSGIKSSNTKPEKQIRSLLHKFGFRFRLHKKGLPCKPDIVLTKYKAVIFVHGCFWHGHNCNLFKRPSSNTLFWDTKFLKNKERDTKCIKELSSLGWKVMIVWECAVRGKGRLEEKDFIKKCREWLVLGEKNSEITGHE